MNTHRVLIVAHGHPKLNKGGGEVAAYHLFTELRKRGIDALFVGRTSEGSHGDTSFSRLGDDRELLFHTVMGDYFTFQASEPSRVWRDFRDLLERFQPDVVHFQHYVHLGLECIHQARRSLPDARIVLTLHEYLAICTHNGQMVKRGTHELCKKATPGDCSRCMPEYSVPDLFLRERYIKSILANVDVFIAPSAFLARRYEQWGLSAEKLVVLDNDQPRTTTVPPRRVEPGELRGRLAYFGQINPYKGLDVLLEAMSRLPARIKKGVHLDVYGAMFYEQPGEFVRRIEELRQGLGKAVTFHGAYEHEDIGRYMARTDWVIVPSIWWENSPLVIQEAFAHGRPVICSDIGGMAEKVRHNVDGLHFPARDPAQLALTLVEAVENKRWDRLRSQITRPVCTLDGHLELYGLASPASKDRTSAPLAAQMHDAE